MDTLMPLFFLLKGIDNFNLQKLLEITCATSDRYNTSQQSSLVQIRARLCQQVLVCGSTVRKITPVWFPEVGQDHCTRQSFLTNATNATTIQLKQHVWGCTFWWREVHLMHKSLVAKSRPISLILAFQQMLPLQSNSAQSDDLRNHMLTHRGEKSN